MIHDSQIGDISSHLNAQLTRYMCDFDRERARSYSLTAGDTRGQEATLLLSVFISDIVKDVLNCKALDFCIKRDEAVTIDSYLEKKYRSFKVIAMSRDFVQLLVNTTSTWEYHHYGHLQDDGGVRIDLAGNPQTEYGPEIHNIILGTVTWVRMIEMKMYHRKIATK